MFEITKDQIIMLVLIIFIFYLGKYPNEYYIIWQQFETFFGMTKPEPAKMKIVSANIRDDFSDHLIGYNKNEHKSEPKPKSKTKAKSSNVETWKDLAFVGTNTNANYHQQYQSNISRKNLPIYYPISSPLDDSYFNYLNSISSPKLSTFRNVLRKVEIFTNQGQKTIIFNYAEQPTNIIKIDPIRIRTLANTICNLINQNAKSLLQVKFIETSNEIHEETEEQSRINFDLKLELSYADSEKLGFLQQPDIILIQSEFIFDKIYCVLPEDNFFNDNKKIEFKAYLSKLIVIGAEHMGFLGGRFDKKFPYSKKSTL